MKSFKGGIHPEENKITTGSLIKEMPAPELIVIPFSQHTGAPAKPLVKKGDRVLVGMKIGEAEGYISSPIHSSVSGKVKDIRVMPHPVSAIPVLSCVIVNDGENEPDPSIKKRTSYDTLSVEELKNIIKEAGIVGLGGAAFPTNVKLSPPPEAHIDTLIINGAECEPYLTADDRLMQEMPERILEGANIIAKILGVKEPIFAIEENKPEAISKMKAAGANVVTLKTKYPQGAEKQLIKAILDREVPRGGLPFMVGVVVQNIGTVKAVADAVIYGEPLYKRVLTVTGDGVKNRGNLLVAVGTLFKDVIDFMGGYTDNTIKLIMGGPMMGISQKTDTVPVIKGTSGILLLKGEQANIPHSEPCINCGECVEVCPMHLVPTLLAKLSENGKVKMANRWGIMDCIECGSCSYVCPAGIKLVQAIRLGKYLLRKERSKK